MNFKEIFSNIFSSFQSSSSDSVVGIDIGSSYIKLVQLKKEGGRIALGTYGEIALGPYEEGRVEGQLTHLEEEKLAEAIQSLIKQANVDAKEISFSIASSSSLIFILTLPRISEQEIAGAVENEVRRYIPIPLSEISLDWWIIPEEETFSSENKRNEIHVLVAAVRNEAIEKYENIVKALKFEKHSYEIETFSAIRSSLKHELNPVMLVDFGASGTRVSVTEHGVLRKFSIINRGSAYLTSSLSKSLQIDFKDAEEKKRDIGILNEHKESEIYKILETGLRYIFSEMKKVLLEFERDYNRPVSKIVLIGGGSLLPGLKERIEFLHNIETVYADPFSHTIYPDFLEEVLKKAGPEFSVALGLALQKFE